MNPARLRAYTILLFVAIMWGVASPVIKFTLEGFGPLTFLTYRFGISTVLALITFSIFGLHLPKKRSLIFMLLGHSFITSVVSLGFLFLGLKNTTVLDTILIALINPLIISVAGVMFLNDHITKREKIGMSIAIAGTVLTVIEPLIQNHNGSLRLSGNLLILGYVLSGAIGAVFMKKLLRADVRPLTISNSSFVVGFVCLLPFFLLSGTQINEIVNVSGGYHLGVWYMAIISGSLAYYLGNKANKSIEVSEASLFSYLQPIFAAPLAVLWLGEKITPVFIIGAIIIAIGVAIAEIKKKRYNTKRPKILIDIKP